jgi:hypothetical protein
MIILEEREFLRFKGIWKEEGEFYLWGSPRDVPKNVK